MGTTDAEYPGGRAQGEVLSIFYVCAIDCLLLRIYRFDVIDPSADVGTAVVDPEVRLLGPRERALYVHTRWQTCLSLAGAHGLEALLRSMRRPFRLASALSQWEDQALGRRVLDGLFDHGFLLPLRTRTPSSDELERARVGWFRRHLRRQRPEFTGGLAAIEVALADHRPAVAAAVIRARCTGRATEAHVLARLARRWRDGRLAVHRIELHVPATLASGELVDAARMLGARVIVRRAVDLGRRDFIAPRTAAVLDAFASSGVETSAEVVLPGRIPPQRRIALTNEALRAHHVHGVWLTLDSAWGRRRADGGAWRQLDRALVTISTAHADTEIASFPSDLHIAARWLDARAIPPAARGRASALDPLRAAHLRRRVQALAGYETACRNPQTVDAEHAIFDDRHIPALASMLALREGSLLLDLCGGIGRMARRFAPFVGASGRVIVLDRDAVSLDRGRALRDARYTNIEFRRGDARDIRLPDGSVDAVFLGGSVDFFLDGGEIDGVLSEVVRVLRAGGRLLVLHPVGLLRLQPGLRARWFGRDLFARTEAALGRAGLAVLPPTLLSAPLTSDRSDRWRTADFTPCLFPRLLGPPGGSLPLPQDGGFLDLLVPASKPAAGASRRVTTRG